MTRIAGRCCQRRSVSSCGAAAAEAPHRNGNASIVRDNGVHGKRVKAQCGTPRFTPADGGDGGASPEASSGPLLVSELGDVRSAVSVVPGCDVRAVSRVIGAPSSQASFALSRGWGTVSLPTKSSQSGSKCWPRSSSLAQHALQTLTCIGSARFDRREGSMNC